MRLAEKGRNMDMTEQETVASSALAPYLGAQGCFLAAQGEWESGRVLVERALSLWARGAVPAGSLVEELRLRTVLAECYAHVGRREEAAAMYLRVLAEDRWSPEALEGYYLSGAKQPQLRALYGTPEAWGRMNGMLISLGFAPDAYQNGWDLEPNQQALQRDVQRLFVLYLAQRVDFSDAEVVRQLQLLPESLQEILYVYHGRHGRERLPRHDYEVMKQTVAQMTGGGVRARYEALGQAGAALAPIPLSEGRAAEMASAAQRIWDVSSVIACLLVEDATYGEANEAYKARVQAFLPRAFRRSALAGVPDAMSLAGRTVIRVVTKWHIAVRGGRFVNLDREGKDGEKQE